MTIFKERISDALNNAVPWTQDAVECQDCGQRWILVRQIGVDWGGASCPYCGGKETDLATTQDTRKYLVRTRVH